MPTVFFPYKSYVELATAEGYALPLPTNAGETPLFSEDYIGIGKAVKELAASSAARQHLQKVGLRAAARHSTRAQGAKLVGLACAERQTHSAGR